jgi:hypothetical protein
VGSPGQAQAFARAHSARPIPQRGAGTRSAACPDGSTRPAESSVQRAADRPSPARHPASQAPRRSCPCPRQRSAVRPRRPRRARSRTTQTNPPASRGPETAPFLTDPRRAVCIMNALTSVCDLSIRDSLAIRPIDCHGPRAGRPTCDRLYSFRSLTRSPSTASGRQ